MSEEAIKALKALHDARFAIELYGIQQLPPNITRRVENISEALTELIQEFGKLTIN